MKKRVLFVGESPYSLSGNANMMSGILSQIDTDKYEICCFGVGGSEVRGNNLLFTPPPFSYIPAMKDLDPWGQQHLLEIIQSVSFDYLFMVGVDIWRYHNLYPAIQKEREFKKFKWINLFPYDLIVYRRDWGQWIDMIDFPLVYSEYGVNFLKKCHPKVEYFRPILFGNQFFKNLSFEEKKTEKASLFPQVNDRFIFGFVGRNQLRKDTLRVIEAFASVYKENPKTALYLHTDLDVGSFNIKHAVWDFGIPENTVLVKRNRAVYSQPDMCRIYNAMDCLINVSSQEGLSWTVVEAMLCGVPSILASNSTAHTELFSDKEDGLLLMSDRGYLPVEGLYGQTHVPTINCNLPFLIDSMNKVIQKTEQERIKDSEIFENKGKEWLKKCDNVTAFLDSLDERTPIKVMAEKRNGVLFAQKRSAGDILMTTQALKGIKDRHPDIPLCYMSLSKYHDILKGNPYIDVLIDWNEELKGKYLYYYNPHEERILPGHWGRNSNSLLSDFYWKILGVDPCKMFILPVEPKNPDILNFLGSVSPKKICVFYSTGQDRPFREYQYMSSVSKAIQDRYKTIQLGGHDDYPANTDLDLRGKLTYREEAWVVSKADLAVTVDTFGAHLCGCMGISQVTLSGSSNGRVVRPKQYGGNQIVLDPDYIKVCLGLGPCSASIRECPLPCMGSIDPEDIIKAISELEEK